MLDLILWCCFAGSVRDLGAPSYPAREAAERRLTRHAWLAWRLCDRPHRCPETRRRARRVAEAHLTLADAAPLPCLLHDLPPYYAVSQDGEARRVVWWAGRQAHDSYLLDGYRVIAWGVEGAGPLARAARLRLGRPEELDTWDDTPYWSPARCRGATQALGRDLLRLGLPRPVVRHFLCRPEKEN